MPYISFLAILRDLVLKILDFVEQAKKKTRRSNRTPSRKRFQVPKAREHPLGLSRDMRHMWIIATGLLDFFKGLN